VISECKDLIEAVLTAHVPDELHLTKIVRNGAEEKQAAYDRSHPFAALISAPGSFDNATVRRAAFRGADGSIEKRYIRGDRIQPIQVRIWTKAEGDADQIVDAVLPWIPHRWEFDDLEGTIEIGRFDASDFASKLSGQYLIGFTINFRVGAATPPNEMP